MNLTRNQKIAAALVVAAGGYLVYRYVARPSGAGVGALPAGGGGGTPLLPSGEAKTTEQVKVLQSALNKLPSTDPKLVVDGAFGPRSAAAVKAFQTSAGLPATGVPDLATIQAMRAALAKLGVYSDANV